MRGEQDPKLDAITRTAGSSPRARGAAMRDLIRHGELKGPSPRARGAAPCGGDGWGGGGAIPACAGSGRTRGPSQPGVIPACAGSRSRAAPPSTRSGGHPRVRGEQELHDNAAHLPGGSSPRARGAAVVPRRPPGRGGVIPACAGSSWDVAEALAEDGGHPRVRGEQAWRRCSCPSPRGSSPRARGAGRTPGRVDETCGVIPACAGSSFLTCNAIPPDPSFPHVVEKQTKPTPPQPSTRTPLPQPRHPCEKQRRSLGAHPRAQYSGRCGATTPCRLRPNTRRKGGRRRLPFLRERS